MSILSLSLRTLLVAFRKHPDIPESSYHLKILTILHPQKLYHYIHITLPHSLVLGIRIFCLCGRHYSAHYNSQFGNLYPRGRGRGGHYTEMKVNEINFQTDKIVSILLLAFPICSFIMTNFISLRSYSSFTNPCLLFQ